MTDLRYYYPTDLTPPPAPGRTDYNKPSSSPTYYQPPSPSYYDSRSEGGVGVPCCPRLSVRLDSVSARHQQSKEGEYSLVRDQLATTTYRQDRREGQEENYIFYFSHPQWSGWLVGPEVTINIQTRPECLIVARFWFSRF